MCPSLEEKAGRAKQSHAAELFDVISNLELTQGETAQSKFMSCIVPGDMRSLANDS